MVVSWNWKYRIAVLLFSLLVMLGLDFARHMISRGQRTDFDMQACIWDPLHQLLHPISNHLKSHDFLRKMLLALDSILIDLSVLYFGITWAAYGRTKSFMPSLLIFYVIRAPVLIICKWPLPKLYLFGDPGIPSFFVDYDQTNDLYFSGHCGCLTVMTTDCFLNGRKKWVVFTFLLLTYTFFVLALEGGHYTNDMIIGVVAGFTINRLYFLRKESITLWYLRVFGQMMSGMVATVQALLMFFGLLKSEVVYSPAINEGEQSKLEASI
jgi:hypothetical protein